MSKLTRATASVAVLLALSGCTLYPASNEPTPAANLPADEPTTSVANVPKVPEPDVVVMPEPTEFSTPVKSPHFVSSTPAHGAILEEAPTKIVLRFNFDIVPPSEIHVSLDADDTPNAALVDYAVGEPTFAADKLSMTQVLDSDLPPGLYTVDYVACWPDTSCHDGSFQFQYGLSL